MLLKESKLRQLIRTVIQEADDDQELLDFARSVNILDILKEKDERKIENTLSYWQPLIHMIPKDVNVLNKDTENACLIIKHEIFPINTRLLWELGMSVILKEFNITHQAIDEKDFEEILRWNYRDDLHLLTNAPERKEVIKLPENRMIVPISMI